MSLCCRGKITSPYIKDAGRTARLCCDMLVYFPYDSWINWTSLPCVSLIDKWLQSSPLTDEATFSSSSCGPCLRARPDCRSASGHGPPPVSSSVCSPRSKMNIYVWRWVTAGHIAPPRQLWLSCLWALKWWLEPGQWLLQTPVRLRVNNIRLGDVWVDTEWAAEWHMYVLNKVFQLVCRNYHWAAAI